MPNVCPKCQSVHNGLEPLCYGCAQKLGMPELTDDKPVDIPNRAFQLPQKKSLICQDCGNVFLATGRNCKRCPDCRKKHDAAKLQDLHKLKSRLDTPKPKLGVNNIPDPACTVAQHFPQQGCMLDTANATCAHREIIVHCKSNNQCSYKGESNEKEDYRTA